MQISIIWIICFVRIWLNRVLVIINMLKCLMNESCVSKLCVALQCWCLFFRLCYCVLLYRKHRGNMPYSAVLTVKTYFFFLVTQEGQEEGRRRRGFLQRVLHV